MKTLTNLLNPISVLLKSKKKVSATFFHNKPRRTRAWENALWRAVALLLSLHYCLVLNLWQLSAREPGLIRVDRTRYRGSAPSVSRRGATSIVNIRKANKSGVSHNLFTDFNVGSGGLVLNNSVRRATSQLVGSLGANANLEGRSASLILNEVTGGSSSSLKGTTEILGQRADYVLANASGIVCDGCGFSNASRVTLSTGRATFNPDGSLSELQVKSGKVEIIGDGLDGGDADYFDIISRQASVASGASLRAKDLQFTLGANRVDYSQRRIVGSTSAALSSGPSLDVAHLGGVEAERITLESTDKGVGVRVDGNMAAGSGGVSLSADGKIRIGGGSSRGKARVSSRGGSVALRSRNGGISVGSGSRLVADTYLSLGAAENIELSAGSSLRASVTASLSAKGDILNAGSISANAVFLHSGVSASEGQVALPGSIVNRGEINASQWLEAVAVGEIENHGLLSAGLGYAYLRSEGRFQNEGSGRIEGISGVRVWSQDFLNEEASLFGGLFLAVSAEDDLESRGQGSSFVSAGLVKLTSSDGDIRLSDTYVGAGDRLHLESGASVELSSSILAAVKQVAVIAQGDVDISESSLVSRRIHLQSEDANVHNRASRIETKDVDLASILFSAGYDSERLEGLLSLLAEARGQGLSDMAHTSEGIRSLFDSVRSQGLGSIPFLSAEEIRYFELELTELYDADGDDGLLTVLSGGDIINEEGGLLSGDRLYLDADGGSGSVYNLGLGSVMASSSDLSFSVSSLINEGTLESEQGLRVAADSISNSGAIRSGSDLSFSVSSLINEGTLESEQGLRVAADSISNSGAIRSGSGLSFSVSSLINEGTLESDQALMVSADSISNSGAIRSGSASRLSLSARESLENFQGPTDMVDGEDADVLFEAANGGLISGGMVSLTAGRLVNRGSSTQEAIIESLANSVDGSPTLLLRVDELLANQGKAQLAGNSLYLDVGRFENTGAFASLGGVGTDSVMVSSRGDVVNQDGGRIAADALLSIVSSDGNIRTATGSSLFGGDTLSLLASSGDISLAGRLRSSADGHLSVRASGDLEVLAAHLSGGTLSLSGGNVLTSVDSHIGDKEGITSSISVVSSGDLHGVSSVFSARNDIRLVAEGDLTLSSSELTSLGSLSLQSSSGDVSIREASSLSSSGDLSVSSLLGEILHTGNSVLESGASLSLRGASIRNEASSIKAASSVSLLASAGSISNALGAYIETEAGDLFLRSVSGDIVNEGGSRLGAGASHSLQLVSGGDFINRGSVGDRDTFVSVASSGDIRNLDGGSLMARSLSLSVGAAGSIANLGEDSEIFSVRDLSLSGSFSLRNEGLIRSDASLSMSLESIDNSGFIASGDSSYATLSSSGNFRNSGTLSGGVLDISVLRFENLDSALIQSHLEDSSLGIRLVTGAGGFYNAGSLEAVSSIGVHSLGDFEGHGSRFTSHSSLIFLSSLSKFSLDGGSRVSGETVRIHSVNDGISISGGTEVSAVSLLDIRAEVGDISNVGARLSASELSAHSNEEIHLGEVEADVISLEARRVLRGDEDDSGVAYSLSAKERLSITQDDSLDASYFGASETKYLALTSRLGNVRYDDLDPDGLHASRGVSFKAAQSLLLSDISKEAVSLSGRDLVYLGEGDKATIDASRYKSISLDQGMDINKEGDGLLHLSGRSDKDSSQDVSWDVSLESSQGGELEHLYLESFKHSVINHGQGISTSYSLSLVAKNNVENLGGDLFSTDISLEAKLGDVLNQGLKETEYSLYLSGDLDAALASTNDVAACDASFHGCRRLDTLTNAGIFASGNLKMTAGRDIKNIAADIGVGVDSQLVAGHDIVFKAQALELRDYFHDEGTESVTRNGRTGTAHWTYSDDFYKKTHRLSTFSLGSGRSLLRAGHDLEVELDKKGYKGGGVDGFFVTVSEATDSFFDSHVDLDIAGEARVSLVEDESYHRIESKRWIVWDKNLKPLNKPAAISPVYGFRNTFGFRSLGGGGRDDISSSASARSGNDPAPAHSFRSTPNPSRGLSNAEHHYDTLDKETWNEVFDAVDDQKANGWMDIDRAVADAKANRAAKRETANYVSRQAALDKATRKAARDKSKKKAQDEAKNKTNRSNRDNGGGGGSDRNRDHGGHGCDSCGGNEDTSGGSNGGPDNGGTPNRQ